MDYKLIYDSLMEKARNRGKLPRGNVESHHVIPRCMGGKDGEVLDLYLREHFIAHLLLTKIYPENIKLKYSFVMISSNNKITKKIINSRLYYKIKEEWINSIKGENNPLFGRDRFKEKNSFYGKKHTEESRKKMSENLKGHTAWNKGKIGIYSGQENPFFGKHHSEESINKIKEKRKLQVITLETKEKMSRNRKGKKKTEDHKQKIKQALIGKKRTEETLEKMRQRVVTEETREKIRKSVNKYYENKKKEVING